MSQSFWFTSRFLNVNCALILSTKIISKNIKNISFVLYQATGESKIPSVWNIYDFVCVYGCVCVCVSINIDAWSSHAVLACIKLAVFYHPILLLLHLLFHSICNIKYEPQKSYSGIQPFTLCSIYKRFIDKQEQVFIEHTYLKNMGEKMKKWVQFMWEKRVSLSESVRKYLWSGHFHQSTALTLKLVEWNRLISETFNINITFQLS